LSRIQLPIRFGPERDRHISPCHSFILLFWIKQLPLYFLFFLQPCDALECGRLTGTRLSTSSRLLSSTFFPCRWWYFMNCTHLPSGMRIC
jgi:hypothetical protein